MSSAFTRYSIETRPVNRRQKNMIPFFLDGVIRARIRLSFPRRRAFYSDKVKNRLYLEFESFLNFGTLLSKINRYYKWLLFNHHSLPSRRYKSTYLTFVIGLPSPALCWHPALFQPSRSKSMGHLG